MIGVLPSKSKKNLRGSEKKTILLALLLLILFYSWCAAFFTVTDDNISGEIFLILMFVLDFLLGCIAAVIVGRFLKISEYVSYGVSFVVLFGIMVALCMIGEKIGHGGVIGMEDVERYEWFRWNVWVHLPQALYILYMTFACLTHLVFLGIKYILKKRVLAMGN